jgi:hypothetical protein
LNQFFTSVFQRDNTIPLPKLGENFEQATDPIILTEQMMKAKIAALRKDAAASPDGLTPKLMKMIGDSILKTLVTIFQKSLEERKVQTEMKNATVRYHCGGWSEEVNSCILIISYMVYL